MDVNALRTFVEVHRLRSFSGAARSLHVTQAAVSARIRQLEAQLGTPLFDRSRKEVRATGAGQRFLHFADVIISEWRRARHTIGKDGAETVQLSIAGSLRLWDILLQSGWLHELRRTRPDMAIWAESGTPESLINRLFDNLLDVVVMLEPPRLELVITQRLTKIDLILASTKRGQRIDEALGPGYVMVDWGQAFELEHRRMFPDIPEPMTTVSNSGMALDYLKSIGGAAFLPRRVIAAEIATGNLYAVAGSPVVSRNVYGLYLRRSPKAALIRDALEVFSPATQDAGEATVRQQKRSAAT